MELVALFLIVKLGPSLSINHRFQRGIRLGNRFYQFYYRFEIFRLLFHADRSPNCKALTHGIRSPFLIVKLGPSLSINHRFERGIRLGNSSFNSFRFYQFYYRFEIFRLLFHADRSPNCKASSRGDKTETVRKRHDASALDQLPFQTK